MTSHAGQSLKLNQMAGPHVFCGSMVKSVKELDNFCPKNETWQFFSEKLFVYAFCEKYFCGQIMFQPL